MTKDKSAKFSSLPEPNFVMSEADVAKAQEEKAKAAEKAADPELTADEKNANKDLHNRADQEIKTLEKVRSVI